MIVVGVVVGLFDCENRIDLGVYGRITCGGAANERVDFSAADAAGSVPIKEGAGLALGGSVVSHGLCPLVFGVGRLPRGRVVGVGSGYATSTVPFSTPN